MLTGSCVLAVALTLQAAGAPVQAPETPPPDQPIQHLFQNLAHDLVALPSRDTAIVIGAAVAGALVAHPADDNLSIWANDRGPSGYTRIGRTAGNGWIQGGAALGTYGAGLISGNRTVTHIGSDLIRAQAMNAVITRGMKLVVGRRRPSGGRESMPSGHTSASFASAAVLANHFGPHVGIPAYAAAGFVGWTRVRDHAHWLTDVIVGSAIGTAVGLSVTRGHRTSAWSVVPTVTAHYVSIQVVRLGR